MIPVNEPLLNGNEKKYLAECIDSGWISSEGPFVERFEKDFATRTGCTEGIAVCNGSAALDLAIAALQLGPGDEVILPTFTIISCAAAIYRAGAIPVPVDIDPATWNMAPDRVAEAITPSTRAIMVVHIYGLPVDMAPIQSLAKQFNLYIIEDAAQAHGQTYRNHACGSLGTIATFSFYPNKHVTTGEGGMVVTNDRELASRCRALRNLCFRPEQRFLHDELGWNFRMTNLQAAVGVAQLERLDFFLEKKRRMGQLYREQLANTPGITFAPEKLPYADNHYWVFGVVLDDHIGFDAKEAMKRLAARGVGTRPFFWPMHEQPVFRNQGMFADCRLPHAEKIARRGFYLPSGLALTDDQISIAANTLKGILQ